MLIFQVWNRSEIAYAHRHVENGGQLQVRVLGLRAGRNQRNLKLLHRLEGVTLTEPCWSAADGHCSSYWGHGTSDTSVSSRGFSAGSVAPGLWPRSVFESDLRSALRLKLIATDASRSGAGACSTRISDSTWRDLYDLAEERGENTRLDWVSVMPPWELAQQGVRVPRSWSRCRVPCHFHTVSKGQTILTFWNWRHSRRL